MLVAVGRRANGDRIGADAAGVEVDERGVIRVDERMRTNVEHIHAIGDVIGDPMLAHKATHQGVVAAEVIAGQDVVFDAARDPVGGLHRPRGGVDGPHRDGGEGARASRSRWPRSRGRASGRALGIGRAEGRTKLHHSSRRRGGSWAPASWA